MNKQIVLTLFCLTLFVAVDAQTVHLSRLQRAAGIGYVPYTDGTGKAAYTLLSSLITPSDFGSGTNNRIAYWLNDTLSSTIWEMNSTYIRGSGTGWPQMDQSSFTFRGDTDTGIERIGSDIVGILAGSANPRIRATSGVVDFDTDASGTSEWGLQPGLFYSITSGAPRIFTTNSASAQYSFTDDTDTGVSRKGADTLAIHAGDFTNPIAYFAGVGNKVAFDANTDGTIEVEISATTMTTELLDIGQYGTTATKIAGLNSSGVVTELIVGSGLSISGDSLNADAGLSGSGSASAVATWSSASALTFTDWLILSNVLQGPTLGDPAMSITDDAYSFTGDSNTGLKWSAADIAGLHAGDATNPMIEIDGTTDAITFDPDDDGTPDVSISATTLSTELLDIGTYGTTAAKIAGLNASGVVTQLVVGDGLSISGDSLITGRAFAQLSYNGEFDITNTSLDTLEPDFSWTELEVGLVASDNATSSITTNYNGYAEVTFNATLLNQSGGTFSGLVYFQLFKNGTYLTPFAPYVQRLENNESKSIHLTGLVSCASGDDFHIEVYLSTAGTIKIGLPVFNIKKI